jgi:hypothetical protein
MNLLKKIRHYFLPHSSNNHKARILHPSILSGFVAFFLIFQFGINFLGAAYPRVLGFASDIYLEELLVLTNQKRAENGLSALELNSSLNEAALRKAGDMFAFNYWSHVSPSGREPWDFFKEVGYSYLFAGENLARDFNSSPAVVQAWMDSPTHRDNILNANYKEIGLAVVNGTLNGVETTLVVQLFGTPPVSKKTVSLPVVVGEAMATSTSGETQDQKTNPSEELSAVSEEFDRETMVSPFSLTKVFAIALLIMILMAFVVDVYLESKKKIIRLSGRNLAHLIFIFILLLAAILTTQGAVL